MLFPTESALNEVAHQFFFVILYNKLTKTSIPPAEKEKGKNTRPEGHLLCMTSIDYKLPILHLLAITLYQ